MLANIVKKYRAWTHHKKTYAELSALSDRDLADIGIKRYDIARIAREEAERRIAGE